MLRQYEGRPFSLLLPDAGQHYKTLLGGTSMPILRRWPAHAWLHTITWSSVLGMLTSIRIQADSTAADVQFEAHNLGLRLDVAGSWALPQVVELLTTTIIVVELDTLQPRGEELRQEIRIFDLTGWFWVHGDRKR